MFWGNLINDLNYDFANVIQCAVKVFEEIMESFSALSFNVFEYSGVYNHSPRTCHTQYTISPSRPSLSTTESDLEMQEVDLGAEQNVERDIVGDVDEKQWLVVHQTDWNYENNFSFDNSPSI